MVAVPRGRSVAYEPVFGGNIEVGVLQFAIGQYEVTFDEWDACAADGGCVSNPRPSDEGWGRGRRPVINVSWDDAQEYVQWLSQRTGQNYRLPTSAEWQLAARAGSTASYSWGDEAPVCDQIARNGASFEDCADGRTWPVGSFQPNALGLYDMHSNVAEWVQDCYRDNCMYRNLYGGSWNSAFLPHIQQHAFGAQADRRNVSGFRLARTDPVPGAQCYQLSHEGDGWFLPRGMADPELCFRRDYCTGGLGQMYRGCFKWAIAADAPAVPWTELGLRTPPREQPGCYRQIDMDGEQGWTPEDYREAVCFVASQCVAGREQGAGESDRSCFKWAMAWNEPALPWSDTLINSPLAVDVPPPEAIYEDEFEMTSESCVEDCEYPARVAVETPIYVQRDPSSPLVSAIEAGECVLVENFSSLSAPVRGVVLETYGDYAAGDVIYSLAYAGEGAVSIWRRGEYMSTDFEDVAVRWDTPSQTIDPRVGVWWEVVRSNGQRGWIKRPQTSDETCDAPTRLR
jgi:hypothetical protein